MRKSVQIKSEFVPEVKLAPHSARTLVVGEPSLASYIRRGLERRGCNCSMVANLEDAANLAGQGKFDLIITISGREPDGRLLSKLKGSACTVISLQSTPSATCWLLIMNSGEACPKAVRMTPTEFCGSVDRVVAQLQERPAAEAMKAFS